MAHRKRKGLSQEELAEAARLSLRTVQRIEKGESIPRGFTLQALAAALAIPVEALTTEPDSPAASPPDDNATAEPAANQALSESSPEAICSYIVLMHLSAFGYLVFPGANIALPWFLWHRRKHIPEIREAGRRLLNFQIFWTAVTHGVFLLLLTLQIGLIFAGRPWLILTPIVFLFGMYALHAPLLLYAMWQARRGHFAVLPMGLRLL
ncbi:helix-turn-helix domain-containing protein [Hymenobacter jejuensis]|uniref:helix-turn-helix domain-containing protein n=1 Tax=Hymenobacter jejuensis TaxID=2502781 RepID=UPI001E483582|nr:helix-turn-helix domain-containing protein [Hymenobacter jejuensis]